MAPPIFLFVPRNWPVWSVEGYAHPPDPGGDNSNHTNSRRFRRGRCWQRQGLKDVMKAVTASANQLAEPLSNL
jgi:hypothetical protein